jgi:hypothetical protein
MGILKKSNTVFLTVVSVLLGISGAIGILFLGEVAVRTFTNIKFLGNSSNLFEANRFGISRGNAPNIQGLSFGEPVYTDNNGFRIPHPDYQYPPNQTNKVLILGDSVAFGPGVAEEKSFVGQLRASKPDWAIFNAAVIGYDVNDYLNVVRSLIAKGHSYKFVLLIMCLNDVSSDSAILLNNPSAPRILPFIERINKLNFATAANAWFRENSKLYLYIKGRVADPSALCFFPDYLQYEGNVDRKLNVVVEVAAELRRVGIPLFIVISPYEYQLRAREGATPKDRTADMLMLPQRKIAAFLSSKGVMTFDSTVFFLSQGAKVNSDFFLPFDPMHFSERGHTIMHMFITKLLSTLHPPKE